MYSMLKLTMTLFLQFCGPEHGLGSRQIPESREDDSDSRHNQGPWTDTRRKWALEAREGSTSGLLITFKEDRKES